MFQFEAAFRMSFYGDVQARRDTAKMQLVRDQADWLLNNMSVDLFKYLKKILNFQKLKNFFTEFPHLLLSLSRQIQNTVKITN